DLHRADGETLAILADVTADLAACRILVLASFRPAEASEQLSDCLAALAVREPVRVTLGGLDAAAAGGRGPATRARPARGRTARARPVDGETARAIAERTGGNPFFIKETARLLDSEGALAATTEVPAGVREVLLRRIARLPATAQTILRQAAVLGADADADVLGEVAGAEEHVLLDAIEAGLLTGLVTEPGPGRIRFAHALVRDTLYHSLSRLRPARRSDRAAHPRPGDGPGPPLRRGGHQPGQGGPLLPPRRRAGRATLRLPRGHPAVGPGHRLPRPGKRHPSPGPAGAGPWPGRPAPPGPATAPPPPPPPRVP